MSKPIKLAVFSEWGAKVGSGHLMRSKRLVSMLNNIKPLECDFFNNQHYKTPQTNIINIDKTNIHHLAWLDIDIFSKILNAYSHIIIDSYLATTKHYELALMANKRLLIIDDFNKTYPNEAFILNGMLGADNTNHKKNKRHFFGVEYNVADNIFKHNRTTKDQIRDILITFGGSDKNNLSTKTIDTLLNNQEIKNTRIKTSPLSPLCVHIVLGAFFSHNLSSIHNKATTNHLSLHHYHNLDSSHLSNLMKKCDIAICAGGQSLYELALSQLPSLIFMASANQMEQSKAFALSKGMQISSLSTLILDIEKLCAKKRENMRKNLEKLPIGTKLPQLGLFLEN